MPETQGFLRDLADIKGQLREMRDDLHDLRAEFRALKSGLDDDIELAIRRRMDHSGKSTREQIAWVIGIIAFALATLTQFLGLLWERAGG